MTWNMTHVSMNELSHEAKLVVQFEALYTDDDKTLDCLVFPKLRYFMTSTSEGKIHIFKYRSTGKVEN
jgi:hypothetical protein